MSASQLRDYLVGLGYSEELSISIADAYTTDGRDGAYRLAEARVGIDWAMQCALDIVAWERGRCQTKLS